jgi:hypothetical protein
VTWAGGDELLVEDEVRSSAEHEVAVAYVLPAEPVREAGAVVLRWPEGGELRLVPEQAEGWKLEVEKSWHSPMYSQREPAWRVVWRTRAAGARLAVRLGFT